MADDGTDFLGRDEDELQELMQRELEARKQRELEESAGMEGIANESSKQGWLTDTQSNSRYFCILYEDPNSRLELYESQSAGVCVCNYAYIFHGAIQPMISK